MVCAVSELKFAFVSSSERKYYKLSKLMFHRRKYSSFELFSTAVLLDKIRMFAGLASSQCKLFTNTNENANKYY